MLGWPVDQVAGFDRMFRGGCFTTAATVFSLILAAIGKPKSYEDKI